MGQSKQNSTLKTAVIGLKLLLICALVAGVVSFVYNLTNERYESNKQATKNAAIGEIFGLSAPICEEVHTKEQTAVYRVTANGETLGYCADVKIPGFGGDIEMMVGYTADGKVLGVNIVAHSETPGMGENVKYDPFLSQFTGKGGELVLGTDIDAVSGATISSQAVTDGINLATQAVREILEKGGAAE